MTAPELIFIHIDGVRTPRGQCPKCGQWADLDDDQFHGRISIECPTKGCDYHETHDLSMDNVA